MPRTARSRPTFALVALASFSAVLSAGCMDSIKESFSGTFGEEETREAFSLADAQPFSSNLNKEYEFTVDELTSRIVIDVALKATGPPIAPAQATVTVYDSTSAARDSKALSPQATSARFEIVDFPNMGAWSAVVKGQGLAGGGQGASYTIAISESLKE